MKAPKRDFKTQLIVLTGPSGIGKSYWARANTSNAFNAFDGKWFDGYDGISDIIINDMTGVSFMELRTLLQIADEGGYSLQWKGGVMNIAPRRLVMTSNIRTQDWYEYAKIRIPYEALRRRIDYHYDVELLAVEGQVYFDEAWTAQQDIADPYPKNNNNVIELSSDDEEATEARWQEFDEGREAETVRRYQAIGHKKRLADKISDLYQSTDDDDGEQYYTLKRKKAESTLANYFIDDQADCYEGED